MVQNRSLTSEARNLVKWMLENGGEEANGLLPQLELAEVTPWRCPCGCASFNLQISGYPEPSTGCHPIADFVFGDDQTLSGIFVFESGGVLKGLEVYGLAGDAPKVLPEVSELRPLHTALGK